VPHTDPTDPPRRRANKAVGHGTWENDRVPIAGVVGRDSGRLDLKVVRRPSRAELVDGFVVPLTHEGTVVDTDDWCVYASLPELGRRHASVNHAHHEWARDDDGDGEREVHDNTLEGIWTGLREYLRPFRGVNKVYLAQYVAMFRWAYNLKAVTPRFLRILLGVSILTYSGP
jgi:transposase